VSLVIWSSVVAGLLTWSYTGNLLLAILASSATIGASAGTMVTMLMYYISYEQIINGSEDTR
jgi:amino acid transporter